MSDGPASGAAMHADLDIFQHRHRFEQSDILKSPRDSVGNDAVAPQTVQFVAFKSDGAFGGRIDSGDHIKYGGLAGTVRTYQA